MAADGERARELPPFQPYATAAGFLTDTEMDRLIADHCGVGHRGSARPWQYERPDPPFAIVMLGTEAKHVWLYDRLWAAAQECNRQFFCVDIAGVETNVQLGRYDSSDRGFYDWHTDFAGRAAAAQAIDIDPALTARGLRRRRPRAHVWYRAAEARQGARRVHRVPELLAASRDARDARHALESRRVDLGHAVALSYAARAASFAVQRSVEFGLAGRLARQSASRWLLGPAGFCLEGDVHETHCATALADRRLRDPRCLQRRIDTGVPTTPQLARSRVQPPTPLGSERIVYSSLRPGNWDIFYFASAGARRGGSRDHPGLDYDAAFSPDGRWVVFTSERRGNPDLYALELEAAREPRLLIDSPAMEDQVAFSPDGRSIAFVGTASGNADIYVLPFMPETTQELAARHERHEPRGRRLPAGLLAGRRANRVLDGSRHAGVRASDLRVHAAARRRRVRHGSRRRQLAAAHGGRPTGTARPNGPRTAARCTSIRRGRERSSVRRRARSWGKRAAFGFGR